MRESDSDGGWKPPVWDDSRDRLELEHDWSSSDSLVVTIMEGLERVSGRSSDSFPPLHETLDAEALEKLFSSQSRRQSRGPGQVIFTVGEFTVAVYSDGTVLVGRSK